MQTYALLEKHHEPNGPHDMETRRRDKRHRHPRLRAQDDLSALPSKVVATSDTGGRAESPRPHKAMRVALMANPDAGSGIDPERVLEVVRGLEVDADLFDLGTCPVGDAVKASADRLLVAGGDGSIAVAAAVSQRLGMPLGIIPTGTGNDFARSLGIPTEVAEAAKIAVRGTLLRTMDLGRLSSGRCFVNVASWGLSSSAARAAASVKPLLGARAYPLGAMRVAGSGQAFDCEVIADGEQIFSGRAWQVIAAITGAFGGGAEVSAEPDDGRLDVVVVPAGGRLGLLRRGWGMRRGTLTEQPGVLHRRAAHVEFRRDRKGELNVDGDVIPARRSETATVESSAYQVVTG